MDQHTKNGIAASWNQQLAQSRAKRKASSAPHSDELKIYEKYLKRAIKGKKNPSVLVLGATPELRDLAISHACKTTAADISPAMLKTMTGVMKYGNHPFNRTIVCDWLRLASVLRKEKFSAVLGDVCFNNITTAKHPVLFSNLRTLLEPEGLLITRQFIFSPHKPVTLVGLQRQYDAGKTDWLLFFLVAGLASQEVNQQAYNIHTHQYPIIKAFSFWDECIHRKKIHLSRADSLRLENIRQHGSGVVHIVLKKRQFEQIAKKYFSIVDVVESARWSYTPFAPIYVLQRK